ncbi:MAG: metal ABC transporter ATP-binding protein [Chlamydiae bacterium]|nr:metal ABC transporter ATP-binding protein [Chlamydiota bacterium]
MLQIEHLDFHYPGSQALFENADLCIEPHTFSIIIGPNGGGKTTLLNLIMGFLQPVKGKIASTFQQLGYVPQAHKIDLEFPIRLIDHVRIGCIQKLTWWGGFDKKTELFVQHLLETLDLWSIKDLRLKELSGGQLQRAQIAHALACSPDLLILDEPTSNIDPKAKKQILDILHELKKSVTILMVTHDLETLLPQTDKVFLVSNGIEEVDKTSLCVHTAMGLYENRLIQPRKE